MYNINQSSQKREFEYDLANMILKKGKPVVFLCVGSNKIVADSLGALTGELLKKHYHISSPVLGSMTHPIISKNLNTTLNDIKTKYYNHTIIVIDSSVGKFQNLYNVRLNNFGLNVSYQNSNSFVGDISISSVTYSKGINNLLILKSEEKKEVFKVANFIASGIYNSLKIIDKFSKICV